MDRRHRGHRRVLVGLVARPAVFLQPESQPPLSLSSQTFPVRLRRRLNQSEGLTCPYEETISLR